MPKEVIYTDKAPEPGPYSQAIKYGDLIFVAGQTSEDPITNEPVHDSVAEQTDRILKNIEMILAAAAVWFYDPAKFTICLGALGFFCGIYHPTGLGLISKGIKRVSVAWDTMVSLEIWGLLRRLSLQE